MARGRVKPHEHDWTKVPPIVVVVNDPLAEAKGGETYNARCSICGTQARLHWPSGSLAEAKLTRTSPPSKVASVVDREQRPHARGTL